MNKKIKKCIESLGWSIYEDEQGVDLRQCSPAGEDFGFYIGNKENIIEEVIVYANNFDADEHSKMWIENRDTVSGVPQSVRELIQDADDIQDMLNELADALNTLENS